MILQNWWYTTLLDSNSERVKPLEGDIDCEVLVVGGGMAGLHAALYLAKQKKRVVVLEKNICGGSSTGKSAGFITPDSELELSQLIRRFGINGAGAVWNIASHGVELISDSIFELGLECDRLEQDSLFLGLGKAGREAVEEEMHAREAMGFSYKAYSQKELKNINTGGGYTAGIQYGKTFSINPLLYAQELKDALLKMGAEIYESTEVTEIEGHRVMTHLGSVTAKHIIICIDKMRTEFSEAASNTWSAQTFAAISEPISKKDIRAMFPKDNVMCWDSRLVYSYYRLTPDDRVLIGGGSALTTFTPMDTTNPAIIEEVIADLKFRFPALDHVDFIQYWPGRIDTTKDLIPIVDYDKENPHVQYVLGCVGLPWAAFCGNLAARRLYEPEYDMPYRDYLSIKRRYLIPDWLQAFIGRMASFSLNNFYSKYIQKW